MTKFTEYPTTNHYREKYNNRTNTLRIWRREYALKQPPSNTRIDTTEYVCVIPKADAYRGSYRTFHHNIWDDAIIHMLADKGVYDNNQPVANSFITIITGNQKTDWLRIPWCMYYGILKMKRHMKNKVRHRRTLVLDLFPVSSLANIVVGYF